MSFESLILGIVQGLTEFLPVSSSGHLALLQNLWGITENSLTYDLLLHFSTMVATACFFWRDILYLFREWLVGLFSSSGRQSESWRWGGPLFAVPVTAFIGFPLKPLVERWMVVPSLVGAALLVTSLLLWYASTLPRTGKYLCQVF